MKFYSDTYILASEAITIPNTGTAAILNNRKNIIIKNCAPVTDYISKINNTQVDNAKDIDLVIPMYNVIEYSDNYLKTSENLWQYYRIQPALNNAGAIIDFPADGNNSASLNLKEK